ncbi:MAG: hypothetical protein WAZ94_13470 [Phycisphaerales bacterium]
MTTSVTAAGSVPVAAEIRRMVLPGRGVLLLRRMRRSVEVRCMELAGLNLENLGTVLRYSQLVFQWGVVGAEHLADAETLASVPYATETVPGLPGTVASTAVFDAVTAEDVRSAVEWITNGGELPEAYRGN